MKRYELKFTVKNSAFNLLNNNSVKLLSVRDFTPAQLKHEAGEPLQRPKQAAETLSAAQRSFILPSNQTELNNTSFRYQLFKIMLPRFGVASYKTPKQAN